MSVGADGTMVVGCRFIEITLSKGRSIARPLSFSEWSWEWAP
jgi:hypothetical protein